MSQPDLRVVPISAIRENPVALRSVNVESEDYVGLRDSIKTSGILNPISVRFRKESVEGTTVEYFEIVDGLHRYTAAVEVGLELLPVNVVELDKVELLEAQVMANIHRVETRAVEYTRQLQRIFALNPTMTISDMAARVAKSPSWVSQRLNLLKLEKSIQDLVDDGKISVANAVALSKLPPDEQYNYIDQAISQKTDEFAPTVQARAKELRDAVRQGKAAEPAEFIPTAKPRKFSELKAEHAASSIGPELCRQVGVKSAEDGFALAVAWMVCLDPLSVAAAKASDNEKRQAADDAKKRRAAERAKKRAEEAADLAAKAAEEAGI